jgi:hypothetical protein
MFDKRSTHLAASLVEDDFHVKNRSELLKADNNDNFRRVDERFAQTYPKHGSQVGISKSKWYVGDVKTLWLTFGIGW